MLNKAYVIQRLLTKLRIPNYETGVTKATTIRYNDSLVVNEKMVLQTLFRLTYGGSKLKGLPPKKLKL